MILNKLEDYDFRSIPKTQFTHDFFEFGDPRVFHGDDGQYVYTEEFIFGEIWNPLEMWIFSEGVSVEILWGEPGDPLLWSAAQ